MFVRVLNKVTLSYSMTVYRVDRSIRIKGSIWISWGMIDYKATAKRDETINDFKSQ